MLIIGLAGGVASGKSFVAGEFQKLGAQILDADSLGHEVLLRDEVVQQVAAALGQSVIGENGQLDRKAIAALVFGIEPDSQQNLVILEQIVHPHIANLIEVHIQRYRADGISAVILDAPVMFKAGWDEFCDKIVFVDASPRVRLQRALERGWTNEHFADREASQTSIEIKRQRATDVIDNNSNDSMELNQQVNKLWQQWNLPLPDKPQDPSARSFGK